jgi:hypothetical protein
MILLLSKSADQLAVANKNVIIFRSEEKEQFEGTLFKHQ